MTQFDPDNLKTILPLIVLVGWACILLLVDLFIPKWHKGWTALLAAAGLALSMGIAIAQAGQEASAFGGMVTLDGFLMEKYQAGMISREEVINKSQDPTTVQAKLQEWEMAQAVAAAAQQRNG